MHQVEDDAVPYCKAFSLTNIGHAGERGESVPVAAIVEHRKAVKIAFYKNTHHGGDPTGKRDKGEKQDTNDIYRLPKGVPDRQPDTARHVAAKFAIESHRILLPVQQRVCLSAEIDKQRRSDDEHQVFEDREAEKSEHEMDHHPAHQKKIIEDGAALVVEKTIDTEAAKPGDDAICSAPEEIDACKE